MENKKSTVGDPIWVESLLTAQEWKEQSKKYSKTYRTETMVSEFECEFKWRKRMGNFSTQDEIKTFNARIDFLIDTKVLLSFNKTLTK